MREHDKAMVKKALSIYECLKDLSESSILCILCKSKHRRVLKSYKDYSEFINWQEQNSIRTIAAIKLLEEQVISLKSVITDMELVMACKNHDLEATKRELAELRDRYEN